MWEYVHELLLLLLEICNLYLMETLALASDICFCKIFGFYCNTPLIATSELKCTGRYGIRQIPKVLFGALVCPMSASGKQFLWLGGSDSFS